MSQPTQKPYTRLSLPTETRELINQIRTNALNEMTQIKSLDDVHHGIVLGLIKGMELCVSPIEAELLQDDLLNVFHDKGIIG